MLIHQAQTVAQARRLQQEMTCPIFRGVMHPRSSLSGGQGLGGHVREFRGYRRAKAAVKDARFPQFAAPIGSPTPRFAAPFGRP